MIGKQTQLGHVGCWMSLVDLTRSCQGTRPDRVRFWTSSLGGNKRHDRVREHSQFVSDAGNLSLV